MLAVRTLRACSLNVQNQPVRISVRFLGKKRKMRRLTLKHQEFALERKRAFKAIGIRTMPCPEAVPSVYKRNYSRSLFYQRKFPLFRHNDHRLL